MTRIQILPGSALRSVLSQAKDWSRARLEFSDYISIVVPCEAKQGKKSPRCIPSSGRVAFARALCDAIFFLVIRVQIQERSGQCATIVQ